MHFFNYLLSVVTSMLVKNIGDKFKDIDQIVTLMWYSPIFFREHSFHQHTEKFSPTYIKITAFTNIL